MTISIHPGVTKVRENWFLNPSEYEWEMALPNEGNCINGFGFALLDGLMQINATLGMQASNTNPYT